MQTEDDVRWLLSTSVPAVGPHDKIKVLSCAREVSPFRPYRVATISFELDELPAWMKEGNQWKVTKCCEPDEPIELLLDTHFLGFTVLNEVDAESYLEYNSPPASDHS